MVVDIATQQQSNEIFTKNLNHHRPSTSMNVHRPTANDLSQRAQLVLGCASTQIDYSRQPSIDSSLSRSTLLNIEYGSREADGPRALTHVPKTKKDKSMIKAREIVGLVMKLVELPNKTEFPPILYRPKNITESDKNSVKLSDNENDDDHDEIDEKNKDNDDLNRNSNQSQTAMNDETLMDKEMENDDDDDDNNPSDPTQYSLLHFVRGTHSPQTSPKASSSSSSALSIPAPTSVESARLLTRREELIRSFSSSINAEIDLKQPTLPIAIPKHLFFNTQNSSSLKRSADDQETTSSSNQKKNKISHSHENHIKIEPTDPIKSSTGKNEPIFHETNEINHSYTTKTQSSLTAQPLIKEKPTASVKPLLQTANVENLSVNSTNSNLANGSDRLTTMAGTLTNPNRRNYMHTLQTSSIRRLNSLAREKKKQADGTARHTFEDIRQSMSLYLESVCYFVQCAHVEPVPNQRAILLTATLKMLEHLAQNHSKMFHLSNTQSLSNLRQKFLLINYWFQSFLYKLQHQSDWTAIERCAGPVNEYFQQRRSPPSSKSSDRNDQYIYDFSKYMLTSYQSESFWIKADRLQRDTSLKDLEKEIKSTMTRGNQRDLAREKNLKSQQNKSKSAANSEANKGLSLQERQLRDAQRMREKQMQSQQKNSAGNSANG